MAVLFGSWYLDILSIFGFLFFLLSVYLNNNFDYWKKRGVHNIKPIPYFGNYKDVFLLQQNLGVFIANMYKKMEGHKFGGLFQLREPILLVRDPEVIKNVLVRDFNVLTDRGLFSGNMENPLSQNLFTMDGKKWKWLRAKLSPTFTSGRMKGMFPLIVEVGRHLAAQVSQRIASGNGELELKDLAARYSTDVIGSCVFGVECNSLADPDSEFRKMGRMALGSSASSFFRQLVVFLLPDLARILRIKDTEPIVEEFFINLVRDTVNYRIKNGVTRNDFLQLLINLRNEHKENKNGILEASTTVNDSSDGENYELDEALMAAQCFVFFFAGFDTSSSTVSFLLYELALQPELQKRVREEIDDVLGDSDMPSYNQLAEMKLLDKCVSETLRKHSIAPVLLRITNAPYTIPETNITLETGTRVLVSVMGLHHDPKYYEDPEKFYPERFNEEEKAQRPSFTYLPFGEGPRFCIVHSFTTKEKHSVFCIPAARVEKGFTAGL